MTQFTTELLNFLAQKQDIDDFFRQSLETAMNELLQAELSAFLGYEPYEKSGYNTGNSRNGTYSRQFETKYGTVSLAIPRDRNGEFSPAILPSYTRRDDHLEEMVIKLYQTGVTTREISEIIERMYGHHYSPTTVSNITKVTQENVTAFHKRTLKENYSVLYLDGTYLPLRRGTVSKECVHIALGITPEGYKSVLGYEIAPNENNTSWSDLLNRLQRQGVQQVSLVVTDGFNGLERVIQQVYPLAKQQRCLVHIARNMSSKVKRVDRAPIIEQFKQVYRATSFEEARKLLRQFMDEWKSRYKKVMESLEKTENLFTFYQFPYCIWPSIYSTNLIESLNKEIKRQCKKKVVFPNEESLERWLVTIFEDYNFKFGHRVHKGFGACSDTLDSLFD
ncbi:MULTISPECIES: IS256-like element ISSdy3 family transposase [Streptococcus]|uniref:IS256-like element ISSdy3 family transposase n=1 Tax=Streptococcus dysgalactiae TaxID=1334 RepID=UPI001CF5E866|nr:IS256-like element ISSdy3 family transposase [Streptococcus dysgalactiae]MCB2836278.1 IS256 family transposase [Streptococcus dysgalactiae subsp. dysgalactiae]MCB2849699.1 IS256 family transposase [Streptococcus dysgalactiae subsp. dysgalactiae]